MTDGCDSGEGSQKKERSENNEPVWRGCGDNREREGNGERERSEGEGVREDTENRGAAQDEGQASAMHRRRRMLLGASIPADGTHRPELYEILQHGGRNEQTVHQRVGQEQDEELVVGEAHAVVHPADAQSKLEKVTFDITSCTATNLIMVNFAKEERLFQA